MSCVKHCELLQGMELTPWSIRKRDHHYVNRKVRGYQPWEGLSWSSQLSPEKQPNKG